MRLPLPRCGNWWGGVAWAARICPSSPLFLDAWARDGCEAANRQTCAYLQGSRDRTRLVYCWCGKYAMGSLLVLMLVCVQIPTCIHVPVIEDTRAFRRAPIPPTISHSIILDKAFPKTSLPPWQGYLGRLPCAYQDS